MRFIVALFALLSAERTMPGALRPNIVVILADDMGFSDVGCYGSEIATPNIDRLAKEGLRYTQFYNAARCCPSRASLLTGLYPHQTGIGHMVDEYASGVRAKLGGPAYQTQLNQQCVTLAEALRAGGYATGMAGKWHVGAARDAWPDRRGFDRSFALIAGASNYFGWGKQNTRDEVMPYELNGDRWEPPREGFFTTDAFTDRAVEFVREPRPADKPFFFYLAYNAPHWPLQELPENIAAYRSRYRAGWDALREQRHRKQATELGVAWALSPPDRFVSDWGKLDDARKDEWDLRMAVYAAQISHLDRGVGRVLETLRETGAERNTLVLFLSDNGACHEKIGDDRAEAEIGTRESYQSYRQAWANVSNVPFRRFKTWVHEGGISTPLIARWPEGIEPGRLSPQVGSILDLMPTFLQLADTEYPKTFSGHDVLPVEGVSLAPTFRGESLPERTLCWEHEGNRAVLRGETKLVARFGGPWELYDLGQDRTELHDLATERPEVVRELAAVYAAWAARCNVRPWELTKE